MKSLDYFEEDGLSIQSYKDQFETCKPELGKTYLVEGALYFQHFKIVYIGEGVALGVEVANGNGNFWLGGKQLFLMDGFKYGDPEAIYRLKSEVE